MDERHPGERPKLRTPYYPSKDSEGVPFVINTAKEKAVAAYANISIAEVYQLDVFTFWALLHDAVVYNHSQTKAGIDWLKNAWRLTQTEPDDDAVDREIMKRGGKVGGR